MTKQPKRGVAFYNALTADNPHQEAPREFPLGGTDVAIARQRAEERGALIGRGNQPEPIKDAAERAAKKAAEKPAPPALVGSALLPSLVQVDGFGDDQKSKVVQLGYVVRRAFEDSQLTVTEWNELPGDVREAKLAAKVEHLKANRGEN